MAREYTRADDEFELWLMRLCEDLGIEVRVNVDERPSMLAELIAPVSDKMRNVFAMMFGGLS